MHWLLIAVGIIAALGINSVVMVFGAKRSNQLRIKAIDRMEAFYAGELGAWNAQLRVEQNLGPGAQGSVIQLDNTPFAQSAMELAEEPYSSVPGAPLSVRTTLPLAPAQALVRRLDANRFIASNDALGSRCGRIGFTSQRSYRVCLHSEKPPQVAYRPLAVSPGIAVYVTPAGKVFVWGKKWPRREKDPVTQKSYYTDFAPEPIDPIPEDADDDSPPPEDWKNFVAVPTELTDYPWSPSDRIRQVVAGAENHNATLPICFLTEAGRIYCVGWANITGAGTGSANNWQDPRGYQMSFAALDLSGIQNPQPFTDIISMGGGGCGLMQDQRLACWGQNIDSSYGMGVFNNTPPVNHFMIRATLMDLSKVNGAVIGLGQSSSAPQFSLHGGGCLVTRDNTPYCWGGSRVGSIYADGTDWAPAPSPLALGTWVTIERYFDNSLNCLVAKNYEPFFCWTVSESGRFSGNKLVKDYAYYQRTARQTFKDTSQMGPTKIRQLYFNHQNTALFALSVGGELFGWTTWKNVSSREQYRDPDATSEWDIPRPERVFNISEKFKEVRLTWAQGCALSVDDHPWCWTASDVEFSTLGNGGSPKQLSYVPVKVKKTW